MSRLFLSTALALALGSTYLQAQNPLTSDTQTALQRVQDNILKAAEKMPESDYEFKPTQEVRSFGQLIAHVADAQMAICGIAKGEPRHGDAASKTSKADLVAALQASNDFCQSVYNAATDAGGTEMVKLFGSEKPKLGVMNLNVAHDNEMYGTIAVYLRLKGLVPPSTEAAKKR